MNWDQGTRQVAHSVRVLLVEDHVVVRHGLAVLLERNARLRVVGGAGSVAEAIAAARRVRPDVVLMDMRLPDGSGVEACREIRSELASTRVLMLSSYPDQEAVIGSILAGAVGYLLKDCEPERLFEAIHVAARGGSLLDPAITPAVLEWMQRVGGQVKLAESEDHLEDLSAQERRILPLIAEGQTNREIAAALALSEHTVKAYVSSILLKLGLGRRSQAAAFIARIAGRPDTSPSR